jgi:hypothetical protein
MREEAHGKCVLGNMGKNGVQTRGSPVKAVVLSTPLSAAHTVVLVPMGGLMETEVTLADAS